MYSQMRNVSTNSNPQNENIKCNETKLQMPQDENIKSQTGDGSVGFFRFSNQLLRAGCLPNGGGADLVFQKLVLKWWGNLQTV